MITCRILVVFTSTVCPGLGLLAQDLFQHRYGSLYWDEASRVIQTQDQHFVVVGHTNGFGSLTNAFFMKVDTSGSLLWVKDYAGINADYIHDVLELADGSLVTCGFTGSYGAGGSDAFVMKTDSTGELIWARVYGDIDSDEFDEIVSDGAGGFYVSGMSRLWPSLLTVNTISRLDSLGNLVWSNQVTQSYSGAYAQLTSSATGGVVLGHFASQEFRLWRFSSSGSLDWTNTYTPAPTGSGLGVMDVLEAGNGNIVVTTTHTNQNTIAQSPDILVIELDSAGGFLSNTSYGGTYADIAHQVVRTADGGLLVCGWTNSAGNGGSDVCFIKLLAGTLQWAKAYGTVWTDKPYSVSTTQDGGFIMAGLTYSTGSAPDSSKIYLLRADSLGNAGCNEVPWTPQVNTQGMTITTSLLPSVMVFPYTSTVPWAANTRYFYSADMCGPLSMQEYPGAERSVDCFPNPFSSRTTIRSEVPLDHAMLVIVDGSGRVAAPPERVNGTSFDIDRGELPSGLYLARLIDDGHVLATIKLLVVDR